VFVLKGFKNSRQIKPLNVVSQKLFPRSRKSNLYLYEYIFMHTIAEAYVLFFVVVHQHVFRRFKVG
jgi:hypothetical protein